MAFPNAMVLKFGIFHNIQFWHPWIQMQKSCRLCDTIVFTGEIYISDHIACPYCSRVKMYTTLFNSFDLGYCQSNRTFESYLIWDTCCILLKYLNSPCLPSFQFMNLWKVKQHTKMNIINNCNQPEPQDALHSYPNPWLRSLSNKIKMFCKKPYNINWVFRYFAHCINNCFAKRYTDSFKDFEAFFALSNYPKMQPSV